MLGADPASRRAATGASGSASCSSPRPCTRTSPSPSMLAPVRGLLRAPAACRRGDRARSASRRSATRARVGSRAASGAGSTSASRSIGDPELIFLDEPTTGFDPGARRRAWETIRVAARLGKTILLTTHYLDEAEQLADRVAVLREGRDRRLGHRAGADRRARRDRDPLPPRTAARSSCSRPTSRRASSTS